jgi:hypothetical protein
MVNALAIHDLRKIYAGSVANNLDVLLDELEGPVHVLLWAAPHHRRRRWARYIELFSVAEPRSESL